MATATKKNRSEQQARAQLESIKEMVFRLQHCQECKGEDCELTAQQIFSGINIYAPKRRKATEEEIRQYHDEEDAERQIDEDPLAVEVRSGWHMPGSEQEEDEEYKILLCTGGPAVQIIGDLSNNEPETAQLQHQDWFTPWTDLPIDIEDEAALVTYAQRLYFGQ